MVREILFCVDSPFIYVFGGQLITESDVYDGGTLTSNESLGITFVKQTQIVFC